MKNTQNSMRHGGAFLLAMALAIGVAPVWAGENAASGDRGERVIDAVKKVRDKAARLDANHDGWLSESETNKGRNTLGALYGAIERKVDTNHDGRISVDEYVSAQEQALKAADTDRDGWISPLEGKAQKRRLVMELLSGR